MANQSINEKLRSAVVYERNLEEIKSLISKGADVNFKETTWWARKGYTLLHDCTDVEVMKVLLLHGADVNARNQFKEPPLHAVRKVELVRELLKHGADINATNRKGNTVLHLAVRVGDFVNQIGVIKEVLKYGANINITNSENETPLDIAVAKCMMDACKLMIKYTVFRSFNEGYRPYIFLENYKMHKNYDTFSSYLNECICEVQQMKTHKIRDKIPLYDLVKQNFNGHNITLYNKMSLQLTKIDYSVQYPIYNEIILDNIKPFLERLDLLSNLQLFTQLDASNHDDAGKKIILDCDSTYIITEYLPNKDLLNLVKVFNAYNNGTIPIQCSSLTSNIIEAGKRGSETSTSNHGKHIRLE